MNIRSVLLVSLTMLAAHTVAQGGDSPQPVPEDRPAPIGSPQWVARLLVEDDDLSLIREAAPSLLAHYLRVRGLGKDPKMWARDQAALTELLWYYDVNAFQATEGNEILRPKVIKALRQMVEGITAPSRLMLKMPVQLMDYDVTRGVFRIHYPQFFESDTPKMREGFPMRNPLRGVCVHLPGSSPAVGGPNFLRPDTGPGYFRVQPPCRQANHPTIPSVPSAYPAGELPGSLVLRFPRGSLWNELPMDEERASAFVTSPYFFGRIAMAIFVFDIVDFRLGSIGPFNTMHYDGNSQASIFDIKPQALFVWSHQANYPSVFYGAVGNVDKVASDQSMRLTHALVTAPVAARSEPLKRDPSSAEGSASTPAPKDSRGKVAIPPPARPTGGAGQPGSKPVPLPTVPVGR